MHPVDEVSGLQCLLLPPNNLSQYSSHYTSMSPNHNNNNNNNNTPTWQFNRSLNPILNFQQLPPPDHHPNPRRSSSSFSSNNNSTSDEAEVQQQQQSIIIINERKRRRMISNRESARRSRVRKRNHLDELWSQVVWLRNENQQLIDKLNHLSESHDKVINENAQLKVETTELRQMLTDIELNCHYSTLKDIIGDVPCCSQG